ncbi:MAG: hypothetical protein DRQ59_01685 [Gammaproteobacteria bacterium]|nr:MAG: hypothetical protein DRQ59_01685 [Gammaproteobacteria bacterium]
MRKNFRYFRYLVLLLILLFVIVHEYQVEDRVTSWAETLQVQVFAINGDGRPATDKYIKGLKLADFKPIENFVNKEAKRYGIPIDAIKINYGGELKSGPPQPPRQASVLNNILWSLHFRGWALYQSYRNHRESLDINLFISYYDTGTTKSLRHSVGLQRGLIGLINGFASKNYNGSNNVVIAHELMHTMGASDKYDQLNMPVHPGGFADPYLEPLYPQYLAEVMGGRIPISANRARIPEKLGQVVIGAYSAAEIGWYVQ